MALTSGRSWRTNWEEVAIESHDGHDVHDPDDLEGFIDELGIPEGKLRALTRRTRKDNGRTLGTLLIHTTHRDIEIFVDGDAALRVLYGYAGQEESVDFIDPDFSPAHNSIIAVDFASIVAMSWMPYGGGRSPHRTTVLGRNT